MNDPSSANYHKWLTAEEFGEQFGPAQQDIDTVTAWLKSHGFSVNLVYPSGMMIDVSGTAAQVRKAFHTEIHNYRVDGAYHIANAADPQIPAALAPLVVGFASLNDFMPRAAVENVGEVTKDSKSGKWQPAGWDPSYSFSYQNSEQYDVGPLDFAKIYNIAPLWATNSGQGQTIVIIEDTNINAADWTTFRSAFGLSSYPGTLTQVQPPPKSGANNCSNPGTNGDEIEAALDAEWSSAVARCDYRAGLLCEHAVHVRRVDSGPEPVEQQNAAGDSQRELRRMRGRAWHQRKRRLQQHLGAGSG